MPINIFTATLADSKMITPSVKHFAFTCDQSPAFNYEPGQFITIHFEHEGKALKRSYSIANVPANDNRIEFAAGYIEGGPGTNLLFNLEPGNQIQISGPYGRLVLKETPPKRYVLVATSTGVTPYRSMLTQLKQLLTKDSQLNVVILQGVQTDKDILYSNDFIDFASAYPNQVQFRAQLSREKQPDTEKHQYSGYVQHAFADLMLNPADDIVYLCGNPGMIDEAFEDLKTRGFAVQQIIREKYVSR